MPVMLRIVRHTRTIPASPPTLGSCPAGPRIGYGTPRPRRFRKQFGLESAQVVLGHAKPNTTLIYAERDLKKAAAVMAEVG